MKKNIFTLLLVTTFALAIIGCENEGSAEKAGKEIDKVMEKAEKETKNAIDTVKEKIEEAKE